MTSSLIAITPVCDAASARFHHAAAKLARAQQIAGEVDRDDCVPRGKRYRIKTARAQQPGIVALMDMVPRPGFNNPATA